ncbi:MAG: hypothetical protein H7A08_08350 [Oceanospirillaceae bacterium]|nr:hypothetical protein [Oceanospirillaceae bacterium]
MYIFLKILCSFALFMGALWAFLPGGFGVNNFSQGHAQPLVFIAYLAWWLLLLAHPFALYKIWSSPQGYALWLLLPLAMHLIFFSTFARNVSAQ